MTLIEENEKKYAQWKNGAETLVLALRTALGNKDAQGVEGIRKALREHLHTCPSAPMAKLDRLTLNHLQDLFDLS